jgi:4-aminobutyrate aminotransferase-like enzyme
VVEKALQEGLMLSTARQYRNVVWTLMPLPITEELEEGLSILPCALSETTFRAKPTSHVQ